MCRAMPDIATDAIVVSIIGRPAYNGFNVAILWVGHDAPRMKRKSAMPNTYTQIYIQFVFAVHSRDNLISPDWRDE